MTVGRPRRGRDRRRGAGTSAGRRSPSPSCAACRPRPARCPSPRRRRRRCRGASLVNAPRIVRNSLTNPLSPGRPMLESTKNTKKNAITGIRRARPGQLVDVARVEAVVDHPDHEEHRPGRDAVVDHVEDRALDADLVEREQPEHAEAQVGDGAVGDELLDVLLHPGDQRAVDDADDAQHADATTMSVGSHVARRRRRRGRPARPGAAGRRCRASAARRRG